MLTTRRNLICLTFLVFLHMVTVGPVLAQQLWPPEINGERHVYKSVDGVDLNLWVMKSESSKASLGQPASAAPAIVFFFGGGWTSGSPEQFLPQALYLQSRGLTAIVADYRVASRNNVKAVSCVEDAASAVRWIRSHASQLNIDPDRICAAGGSAGGHLACCTALIPDVVASGEDTAVSSVPNALALFNPVVMLAPLEGLEGAEGASMTFETVQTRLGVPADQLSPIHHIRRDLPPTIIFHGDRDTTVRIASVEEFEKRMTAAGNRCELKRFPDAPHGFFNLRNSGTRPGQAQAATPAIAVVDQRRQWHLRSLLQLDHFLASLGWIQGTATVPVVDNPNVKVRGHLQRALEKFRTQKEARVAFLGGSITEMEGYRPLVEKWLTETFPNTKFTFIQAGIASTCSNTGAFRFQRDVLSEGPVDLLLVEFAVNDDQDAHHDADGCIRGMEGILRQLWKHNPDAGAVMLHFVNPEMLATAQAREMQLSARQHEKVAQHYHVSSIDLPAELADRIKDGSMSWDSWGGTHPGPAGNSHAAKLVCEVLTAVMNAGTEEETSTELPEPLLKSSFDAGRFLEPSLVKMNEGWQYSVPDWSAIAGSKRDRFLKEQIFHGTTPGSTLSFEFTGRAVGAYLLAGPDAGRLDVRIDQGEWKTVELYHNYSAGLHYPRTVMFDSDLPYGTHAVEVRIAAEHQENSKGTAARILAFTINE